jgi:hypothetical protein
MAALVAAILFYTICINHHRLQAMLFKSIYLPVNLFNMKKIILPAAITIAILFASCKKDRTCSCTTTYGSYTYVTVTKAKSGKKAAQNWCASNQTAVHTDSGNANTVSVPAPTCKLD